MSFYTIIAKKLSEEEERYWVVNNYFKVRRDDVRN